MRKDRRDDEWNDLFRSFDDDFDVMRERMDRLMEAALRGTGNDPLVYGFSMRTGADGRRWCRSSGTFPEVGPSRCELPGALDGCDRGSGQGQGDRRAAWSR